MQVVAAKKDKKGKLMWEALREAVDEEMEKDPNVCVIGMVAFPPLAVHNDPDHDVYKVDAMSQEKMLDTMEVHTKLHMISTKSMATSDFWIPLSAVRHNDVALHD